MEKNELRKKVEMEIQHHISPLIGWLRNDASKGVIDTTGIRHGQWKERAALAVDAIMEHVGEVEYEYKVQHQQVNPNRGYPGWSDSGLGSWTDEALALQKFNQYVKDEKRMTEETGQKGYEYRIVRRPKDSETVYLTEGEDV